MPMAPKITVLLADDHALVRRGFRRMLEDDPDISIVGEASDGKEAVRLACELRPRVTVMDCAMPELSGIEATRRILEKFPEAGILMLSMHSEETLVSQALEAGARGYVLKNAMDLDLVSAVKSIAAGMTVLDPQVSRPETLKGERGGGLTPRQYYGHTRNSQDGRAGGVRDSKWLGEPALKRRDFFFTALGAGLTTAAVPGWASQNPAASLGFRLTDVTNAAGIHF